ncbi:MAG TPA: hypothetical protein VIQ76_05370 [Propionibacteriaceae bacterium]
MRSSSVAGTLAIRTRTSPGRAAPTPLAALRQEEVGEARPDRDSAVRDRTFREDDSKIHVGHLPRIMAGLRNLAIDVHRQDGRTNIAAALRHTARDGRSSLTALGLTG